MTWFDSADVVFFGFMFILLARQLYLGWKEKSGR